MKILFSLLLSVLLFGCIFKDTDGDGIPEIIITTELGDDYSFRDTLKIKGDFSKLGEKEVDVWLGEYEMDIHEISDSLLEVHFKTPPCETCDTVCAALNILIKDSEDTLYQSPKANVCFVDLKAPRAESVKIEGTPSVGMTLTGSYTFKDDQGDSEGSSKYQWLAGGDSISGATETSYTVRNEDTNKTLSFSVLPMASEGENPTGEPVTSDPTEIVKAKHFPGVKDVTITGDVKQEQTLTGSYTFSDVDGDEEGDSKFQWYRDSVAIDSANQKTYTIIKEDSGKTLSFEVTPVAKTGDSLVGQAVRVTSSEVTGYHPPKIDSVAIVGAAKLNSQLVGIYTFSDEDGDLEDSSTYQWYRDTVKIDGATDTTYTLREKDLGKKIIFEVKPVAKTGVNLVGVPKSDTLTATVVVPDYEPGQAPGDTTKWLLRVTGLRHEESFKTLKTNGSDSSEMFAIRYRHYSEGLGQKPVEFSYIGETAEDAIDRSPTLKIVETTGLADYGRDNDLDWEGIDVPSKRYFGIDADASGLTKDRDAGADDWSLTDPSLNLQYHTEVNKVRITDKLADKSADFDLFTGDITGDAEITHGYTKLQDWFADYSDQPFTDTVSDAGGYCAVVGIFADYRTVALHECGSPGAPPDSVPPWDVPAIPDSIDNPPPPDPPKQGPEGLEEDREEFGGEEYKTPITGGSLDPESSIPKSIAGVALPRNLSEVDNPRQHKLAVAQGEFEKKVMENADTHFDSFLDKAITTLNSEDNKRYEEYAASKGAHVPTRQEVIDMLTDELGFNPLDPCADMDMNAPDFGLKLVARMMQILGLYNSKATTFLASGDDGFKISQQAAGLAESEAAWQFLKFFGDAMSYLTNKGIDIVTAGGLKNFLKDQLTPSINDYLKSQGVSTIKEAFGTEEKVNNFIDGLVDDLPWTDVDKNAFKGALKKHFAEDPENIADPVSWIRVFFDTFFGLATSLAQSQIDGIKDLKKQGKDLLSEGLMALAKARFLLETLKELHGKLKTEYVVLCAEVDSAKVGLAAAQADYMAIKAQIEKVIKTVLDDIQVVNQIMAGNPTPEQVKQRVMGAVANCVQAMGINIQDLGEITFEVTITVQRDGNENVTQWTYQFWNVKWVIPLQ